MPSVWLHVLALALLTSLFALPAARADLPEPDKLPPRPGLPDPLVMQNGEKVRTKEQWINERRPELKQLFQHYMYGYFPAAPKVTAKVERVDPKALGGKATLKEITLSLGGPNVPKLHVLLVVPNHRTKPAPVFVGLNFTGNHTVLNDPMIHLPEAWLRGSKSGKATDKQRGTAIDTWALEQTIDRGYAVATCYYGDIVPDDPKRRDEGIQPHFKSKDAGHEWGAVAAWAWGLERIIDYLVTDPDLDARRIIVVGHSRLGKTALLAGAFDDRIAVVMPHQAGQGGSAPSRGTVGESVKRINTAFPHWFNAAYKQFNDHPERLPFDQNALVALCAPRPVLFTNAVEDTWANPEGQFQVLRAADPVYRFLGVEGIDARAMPKVGTLVDSRLGYWIRDGKHSMTPEDWRVFADFADKHLGKPGTK
jgi:hypothetical protein